VGKRRKGGGVMKPVQFLTGVVRHGGGEIEKKEEEEKSKDITCTRVCAGQLGEEGSRREGRDGTPALEDWCMQAKRGGGNTKGPRRANGRLNRGSVSKLVLPYGACLRRAQQQKEQKRDFRIPKRCQPRAIRREKGSDAKPGNVFAQIFSPP